MAVQGLSNAIFLRRRALLIELFAPSLGSVGAALGHQPLALSAGMHYLGLPFAEPVRTGGGNGGQQPCGALGWKLDPLCMSYVNVSRLGTHLDRARRVLPFAVPDAAVLASLARSAALS